MLWLTRKDFVAQEEQFEDCSDIKAMPLQMCADNTHPPAPLSTFSPRVWLYCLLLELNLGREPSKSHV